MIGVHVCEVCGAISETIGAFLNHMEEAHGLVPEELPQWHPFGCACYGCREGDKHNRRQAKLAAQSDGSSDGNG